MWSDNAMKYLLRLGIIIFIQILMFDSTGYSLITTIQKDKVFDMKTMNQKT